MAARYWVGGTANWDNTAGTKWSDTSGGAGGFSIPTASDNVFFDANSGAVTVTTSGTVNALSITTTGFTGTLTINSSCNLYGNLTIGSSSTINGSNAIIVQNTITSTITNNGVTIGCSLTLNSASLVTLADAMTLSGNLTLNNGTGGYLNGSTLNLKGNLIAGASNTVTPTTIIEINGTGNQTWSGNFAVRNPLTVNKSSGTLTISGSVAYNTGTLTYTAGTVDATGSTLNINTSGIFDTNGIVWNNITKGNANSTFTLNSNMTIGGTALLGSSSQPTVFNGSDLILLGDFSSANATAAGVTGTSLIRVEGTGSQTWSGDRPFQNNLTINKPSGTLTISGNVAYRGGTLTYTAGTVDASGSTLTIAASTTLNTNGITWNNVTLTLSTTLTINSLLSVSGVLTLGNNSITFAGTHGFTTHTLTTATLTVNRTYTLASTKTYTITGAFTSNTNTSTIRPLFRSSIAASQAILTLNAGATQDLKFVNATDIDSSLGQQINSNKGTLSNATNWYRTNGTFMYLLNK